MPVHITYFVHSITTDNLNHIATGWLPGELSSEGRTRAKLLGHQIAHKKFNTVFCSDLQRAVESAQIMFGDKYKIIQDARLRECNYGQLNGKPHTFKNNMDDYIQTPFPGGESYTNVQQRMALFLQFLRQEYNGRRVAIVAHQAPQLALDVLLLHKTWPQAIADDWRKRGAWQPGWEYNLI